MHPLQIAPPPELHMRTCITACYVVPRVSYAPCCNRKQLQPITQHNSSNNSCHDLHNPPAHSLTHRPTEARRGSTHELCTQPRQPCSTEEREQERHSFPLSLPASLPAYWLVPLLPLSPLPLLPLPLLPWLRLSPIFMLASIRALILARRSAHKDTDKTRHTKALRVTFERCTVALPR